MRTPEETIVVNLILTLYRLGVWSGGFRISPALIEKVTKKSICSVE